MTVIQGASSVEFLRNSLVLIACHTKFGSFTLRGMRAVQNLPTCGSTPASEFSREIWSLYAKRYETVTDIPQKPFWEPSSPVVDVFKIDTFCPKSTICRSTTFLPWSQRVCNYGQKDSKKLLTKTFTNFGYSSCLTIQKSLDTEGSFTKLFSL